MKSDAFDSLFCVYLLCISVSGAPGGLNAKVDNIDERLEKDENEIVELKGNILTSCDTFAIHVV